MLWLRAVFVVKSNTSQQHFKQVYKTQGALSFAQNSRLDVKHKDVK